MCISGLVARPPSSFGLCGFSSTFGEIAPSARVLRDLKDSGELAIVQIQHLAFSALMVEIRTTARV